MKSTHLIHTLLLAAVGIYGVFAYSVTERTREIGIRRALGAADNGLVTQFVKQGLLLALAGIGAGLMGALALSRFVSSLLFGVSTTDPLTFAAVSILLAGVAVLACFRPALRAARVDPMIALRHE